MEEETNEVYEEEDNSNGGWVGVGYFATFGDYVEATNID